MTAPDEGACPPCGAGLCDRGDDGIEAMLRSIFGDAVEAKNVWLARVAAEKKRAEAN